MYHNYQNTNTVKSWTPTRRKSVLSSYQAMGERYEDVVGKLLCTKLGGTFKRSTKNENTRKHIDIWWTDKENKTHSIDVKMPKKTRRSDVEPDNTRTWVELVNKVGNPGWVYGEEKWIAFVREGEFNEVLFTDRAKLAHFVENKVKNSKINTYNSGVAYELYSRAAWGDHDVMTIVPFEDIEPFVDFRLKLEK